MASSRSKCTRTMERRVRGNLHARCGSGENLEITSKSYLSILITLQSTNGQAPFVTVFMYLNEVKDENTKKDLALIIETMLKQRILGVKDRSGNYVTPAFPKLIYVLSENNITEDSPYFYLTKLAAECTAKRMVPDYISEKKMKELKDGDVYPCINKTCA